jgi:tetratricopeptide (TPR) repeat protein
MSRILQLIGQGILLLFVVGFFGWLFWRVLKKSEDAALLLGKWVLTAIVIGFVIWQTDFFGGYDPQWTHIVIALFAGLVLAVTWRRTIGEVIARPFASLYDGGSAEVDPKPFYSVAIAKRKQGKYAESMAEVRKQLERFPTDVEGQMLLAEIQAENLNDLPGAELTVQRFLAQPDHAPANIAFALNSLADWHLKFGQDREAARRDLEKVVELLPGSEWALSAAQRIAHLAGTDQLLDPHNRKRFEVKEGIKDVGLLAAARKPQPTESAPGKTAAEYVKHLEAHPLDTEVREKLAVLYCEHYHRLDLAADQLEQMIEVPNQPPKHVARWLNLLADLQIQHGANYETVRQTLQRIIDSYPTHSAAGLAQNRIDHLKLELKGQEKDRVVKLGTYEQDIGLKRGLPSQL